MEIEDKVHINLMKDDVEKIIKDHFKKQKIEIIFLRFDVKTDHGEYGDYPSTVFSHVIAEGKRTV